MGCRCVCALSSYQGDAHAHVFVKNLQVQNKKPKCKMQVYNHLQARHNIVPAMFIPYIESPKMDWTVNDGLYHRLLKWKLKCENILDCELAVLPESKKCKKVIAWSGDYGMDQYVSWCLPTHDLRLDTIWSKYEEFCKP